MNGEQVANYVEALRLLSRKMSHAAPHRRGGRREVFSLANFETGEVVGYDEPHYSIFYKNSQQWALVVSVGNPIIMGMADLIENAVNGAVE